MPLTSGKAEHLLPRRGQPSQPAPESNYLQHLCSVICIASMALLGWWAGGELMLLSQVQQGPDLLSSSLSRALASPAGDWANTWTWLRTTAGKALALGRLPPPLAPHLPPARGGAGRAHAHAQEQAPQETPSQDETQEPWALALGRAHAGSSAASRQPQNTAHQEQAAVRMGGHSFPKDIHPRAAVQQGRDTGRAPDDKGPLHSAGTPSPAAPDRIGVVQPQGGVDTHGKSGPRGGGGGWIAGSRLRPEVGVAAFRARWECLSSAVHARWVVDSTPRVLPVPPRAIRWPLNVRLYEMLNRGVRRGQYTADTWPAPLCAKYVWTPKDPKACHAAAAAAAGVPPNKLAHPPVPSFRALDSSGFCAALRRKGGSMFIVGDSISGEFLWALRIELESQGVPVRQLHVSEECSDYYQFLKDNHLRGVIKQTWTSCLRWMICGPTPEEGGVELFFDISVYLRGVHTPGSTPQDRALFSKEALNHSTAALGEVDPEPTWGEEMVRHNASVVILNRGTHITETAPLLSQLEYTMGELRRMLPDALLFYRSSPPGHPDCVNYTAAVDTPVMVDTWPFYWDLLASQKAPVQAVVEKAGGVFVDVNPMTELRPDCHVRPKLTTQRGADCLHYLLPGPPNDWVRLFGAMLQELV